MGAGVPADQVAERIGDRLGEHLRHPDRQRGAERVPEPAGVLDGDVPLLAGDAHLQRPPGGDQLVQPRRGTPRAAGLGGGQVAEHAQQVGGAVDVARVPLRRAAAGARPRSRPWRRRRAARAARAAQQLGEQAGVERQRLRPALGQRRVALVEELADVAEQQRLGERARRSRSPRRRPAPSADRTSLISSTSPGTSKTSCSTSRAASSVIGNEANSLATDSSWAARCRCCHSGVRRRGSRRGSSRARAAHSRNRLANSAEPPTSAVTSRSMSSGSRTARSASGGSPVVSGSRSTMPSSECIEATSTP